jgi:hypothetical protein
MTDNAKGGKFPLVIYRWSKMLRLRLLIVM